MHFAAAVRAEEFDGTTVATSSTAASTLAASFGSSKRKSNSVPASWSAVVTRARIVKNT
jgi:hypothetical protein